MAERTIRICDMCLMVDGEGDNPEAFAEETMPIPVEGGAALIDVCAGHKAEYERLKESLAAFERAATPVETPSPKDSRYRTKTGTAENAAIRSWARTQGESIGERGRISDDLRARFRAAQANKALTIPERTPEPASA